MKRGIPRERGAQPPAELSPTTSSLSAGQEEFGTGSLLPAPWAGGNIQVQLIAAPEQGFGGLQRCLKWYLQN